MSTPESLAKRRSVASRWFMAMVSIVFIGLNAFAAWQIKTPPPDCGDFPNCAEIDASLILGLAPHQIVGVAVSVGLALLGVFGIVQIARRGSTRWSAISIVSTLGFWTFVILFAVAAGPGY